MIQAIFLDRDGTIVEEFADGTVDTNGVLLPHAAEGLNALQKRGYTLFFISNQRPIAIGILTEESFWQTNAKIIGKLQKLGVHIEATQMCPHQDSDGCNCRKPKTGMIDAISNVYEIDFKNSWFIGDRPTDVELGKKIGCKTIQVRTGRDDTPESADADLIAKDLSIAAKFIIENGSKNEASFSVANLPEPLGS